MDDKFEEIEQLLKIPASAFLSSLRRRGSVLFLGQKYQRICFGKEYFIQAAQQKLADDFTTSVDSYSELWKLITKPSPSIDPDIIPQTTLTQRQKELWNSELRDSARDAQTHDAIKTVKQSVRDNSNRLACLDARIKTNQMLGAGWNLVVTSAPENLLCNTVGSPFSAENTILNSESPLPQKFSARSLSLLQLFDPCVQRDLHLQTAYGEFCVTDTDAKAARNAFKTAANRILQYNGYLVIDAWDPNTDWFTLSDLKELMDSAAGQNQVQVLFFGLAPDAVIQVKRTCHNNNFTFFSQNTHIVDLFSEDQASECSEDELDYTEFENESIITMKLRSDGPGQGKGKQLEFDIPVPEWDKLSFAEHACIVPTQLQLDQYDATPVSTQQRLISFFAQVRGIPLWNSFESCTFERTSFRDFKERVQQSLRSAKHGNDCNDSSKHGVTRDPLMILKGPACSGKTIMLGQLAMDMALYYPTIYLDEQAVPYLNTEQFYHFAEELAKFIQDYLASHMKQFNRRRVLIIWDGDFFESEARRVYRSLSDKLMSHSIEFTLIGSAYSSSISQKNWSNEYLLREELSKDEKARLQQLLTDNLNIDQQEIDRIFRFNKANTDNLFGVLNALFRDVNDDIMHMLSEGIYRESTAAKQALITAFDDLERAREMGAISGSICNYILPDGEDSVALLEVAQRCASLLDDILAVASSGIKPQPLHYVLVFDMLQEMYSAQYGQAMGKLGSLQDFLDMLLYYSPLIQSNGSIYQDEWTLCYRSPLEAKIFLESKYKSMPRGKSDQFQQTKLAWFDVQYVENRSDDSYPTGPSYGEYFLEFRQMEILHYALKCGLRDPEGILSYDVLPLADVLGPNADRDTVYNEQGVHVDWYPYVAHALLLYGGDNIAACQKAAFWLRRYDTYYINWTPELVLDEYRFKKIDQTEKILTGIISVINAQTYYDGASPNQKVQLYTEWAANRRCVYCPQADFDNELRQTRKEYGQPLLEAVENRIEKNILPLLERASSHPSDHIVDIYIGMLHKAVSVYYAENKKSPLMYAQLDALSRHIDFFWRVVLFKLMDSDFLEYDLQEENRNPKNAARKISEIFQQWAELAQNTGWQDQAQQRMDEQDRQLFSENRSTWWVNRISHLWHGNMLTSTEDCLKALSENLYYSSLQYHAASEKLSPKQLAQAKYIADVMEGKKLLPGCEDRGCEKLLRKNPQLAEYYVRAKWMAETGLFPYTEEAHPKLTKDVWQTLFNCCEWYCNYPHVVKADYFLYYLQAIHAWLLSQERAVRSKSFQYCSKHQTANYLPLRLPMGGYGLANENFMYLCWEDGTPIEVTCVIDHDVKGHRSAAIQQIIVPSETITQMDYRTLDRCLHNKRLYIADSLLPKEGNTARYHIRFNDLGPLAGPVQEGGNR